MNESEEQSTKDCLNLLQVLLIARKQLFKDDDIGAYISHTSKRIKEYGYIADPNYIQELISKI